MLGCCGKRRSLLWFLFFIIIIKQTKCTFRGLFLFGLHRWWDFFMPVKIIKVLQCILVVFLEHKHIGFSSPKVSFNIKYLKGSSTVFILTGVDLASSLCTLIPPNKLTAPAGFLLLLASTGEDAACTAFLSDGFSSATFTTSCVSSWPNREGAWDAAAGTWNTFISSSLLHSPVCAPSAVLTQISTNMTFYTG